MNQPIDVNALSAAVVEKLHGDGHMQASAASPWGAIVQALLSQYMPIIIQVILQLLAPNGLPVPTPPPTPPTAPPPLQP